MNRRYCLVFGAVVLASCSSTDAPSPGAAGATATAGASGSPAGGSSGASAAGSAGLGTNAVAGNVSGGGATSAGAGGATGDSSGASGASSGASGASGASGVSGAGGSAGNGGSSGNAGGAGAPAKYCDTHTLVAAPVIVTEAFDEDQVGKDLNLQLELPGAPDVCDDPAEADAVGSCYEFIYKPETDGGTLKFQWVSDPAGVKYAPVCMAAGMTKVTFAAKGYVGGEKVTFGASQVTPVDITLTDQWKQYSISLSNVKYNSDSQGVQPAFFWTLDPSKNPGQTSVRFTVDDIKYVNN